MALGCRLSPSFTKAHFYKSFHSYPLRGKCNFYSEFILALNFFTEFILQL